LNHKLGKSQAALKGLEARSEQKDEATGRYRYAVALFNIFTTRTEADDEKQNPNDLLH
jgi:hypothetical protein